jgi:hypothetical protein
VPFSDDLHSLPFACTRKNHVPGPWCSTESLALIYAIASGTLRRFVFGPRFVCEICARSERHVSELCLAEAGRAATFPISSRLSFPRLCRHLNPALCHPITVSGCTRMGACFQRDKTRRRATQKIRSDAARRGGGCICIIAANCWRSQVLEEKVAAGTQEPCCNGHEKRHQTYHTRFSHRDPALNAALFN